MYHPVNIQALINFNEKYFASAIAYLKNMLYICSVNYEQALV